jgi:hypothetical protein
MPPFALSDDQLRTIMGELSPLDPAKRSMAMQRIAAGLRLAGVCRPTDVDLKNAIAAALRGLVHGSAA